MAYPSGPNARTAIDISQRPPCSGTSTQVPHQRRPGPAPAPNSTAHTALWQQRPAAAPCSGTLQPHPAKAPASQLQNANMQLCLCLKQEPQSSLAGGIRKCSQIGTATAHYSIWHDSNIESLKLPLTASMQLVGSTTPYRQVHMLGPNVLCIVQLRRTRNDFLSEAHCNMPPAPPGRHRQPEEMLCNFLASQCLCLLWSSWLPDHDWAKTNHNIEKEDAKSRKLLGTWKDPPIQSKPISLQFFGHARRQPMRDRPNGGPRKRPDHESRQLAEMLSESTNPRRQNISKQISCLCATAETFRGQTVWHTDCLPVHSMYWHASVCVWKVICDHTGKNLGGQSAQRKIVIRSPIVVSFQMKPLLSG